MLDISKEEVQKCINECESARQVALKLKISHHTVKRLCQKYNIDYQTLINKNNTEKYVGQIFSCLKILEIKFTEGKNRRRIAICECQCNQKTIITVRLDLILSGRRVSCGCAGKNRLMMVGKKNPAFKGVGELRASEVYWIKRSAKLRKIEYNLTIEYLWQLFETQNRICPYTGLILKFGRIHSSQERTASLDRIDSSKGYIEGNVQWIYKPVQYIKNFYDEQFFLLMCNLIAKNCPIDLNSYKIEEL